MLNIAIHNILQPLLQESSIVSTRTISHRDINLFISEANSRDGGDEVLTTINKNNHMDLGKEENSPLCQRGKPPRYGLPSMLLQSLA